VAGVLTRRWLDSANDHTRLSHLIQRLKPLSIAGLLATVLLLFGFQAETIMGNPLAIVLIAIPLLLQTYGIFAFSYAVAKGLKLPHKVAAPACMIATSNFFELAVAVAISLFGLHSGAALAACWWKYR
jgi:ACR3 family arsenite transporter